MLKLMSVFLALMLVMAAPSFATKPCSPDSWFSKPQRPASEWEAQARWVAVAKVIARQEKVVPFANCYVEDRSQCAMDDQSTVTVKVVRWEKGGPLKIKRLGKSYCGPTAPKEVGVKYRFYGLEPDSYIYFEKVAP